MLSSDLPIKTATEDRLNRAEFSTSLARAIIEHKSPEAFTIGLYGNWGSGKTSVINMLCEEAEKGDGVIIMRFNPWLYSDQKQLMTQFLMQLSSTIKSKDISKAIGNYFDKDIISTVGDLIGEYAESFNIAGYIPGIGGLIKIGGLVIGKITKKRDNDSEIQRKKEIISKELTKLNKKILVTIDDIDRLGSDEICAVFQLVKSVADFPNIVYVLAFDYDIVVDALDKLQKNKGAEYLEKIIQVPFELPISQISEIFEILYYKLNAIIGDLPKEKFDCNRWNEVFSYGLSRYIKTIRDVIRLTNVFSLKYGLLKNETNVVELIAIVALQVFEPETYTRLSMYLSDVCGGVSYYSRENEEKERIKAITEEIIKSTVDRSAALSLLSILFPRISWAMDENILVGYSYDHNEALLSRSISCLECSRRYFSLLMESDDIPMDYFERVVLEDNKESLLQNIEAFYAENKMTRFIDLLSAYCKSEKCRISEQRAEVIIRCLLEKWALFDFSEDTGLFSGHYLWQLLGCMEGLSKRINEAKRSEEVTKLILDTTVSIDAFCIMLFNLEHSYGRFTDNHTEDKVKLVSFEDLLKLEKEYCKRINDDKKSFELLLGKQASAKINLLECIDPEMAKEVVSKELGNDVSIIALIIAYVTHGTVYSRVTEKYWDFDKENFSKYYDIDKAYDVALQFVKSKEYAELSQEEKQDIFSFLLFCERDDERKFGNEIKLKDIEEKSRELFYSKEVGISGYRSVCDED